MQSAKIENLQILKQHNFPVPDFVVVSEPEKVPDVPWELSAVRSAAEAEDGAESSFAGQFDTFLNVPQAELSQKIQECFDSANKPAVREYLTAQGLEYSDLGMQVIVQQMIPADYAGILFTANPQGIENESVIVVGKGLGENVVTDKVETTSYYYNLTDDLYYYEGKENILSHEQIKELIALSKRMKPLLGDYLDIEFAVCRSRIYLLQARRITTMDTSDLLILDNSNIVESYPGLSLPLTCSFVNMVYGGVFEGVSRRILKNEKELAGHKEVFGNMVGAVNGRIYYKISNWYTVIKFLPFSKKLIPVWQEMMGVKNKTYDTDKVKLSFWTRTMTYVHAVTELLAVPRNMRRLNQEFLKINDYFYKEFHPDMTSGELIELYETIKARLLSCWDITLLNDTYTFAFTGLLKSSLKKKYREAEELTNQFLSGISNIESLKPIKALIHMSYHKKDMSEAEYEAAFADYITQYGDRNLEELKLESETFRSNPKLLSRKIAEYNEDADKLAALYENINKESDTSLPKTNPWIRFLARRCAEGIGNREISRLNRSRIYGMVRLIFTQLGVSLTKEGVLDAPEDVFWLTMEEVFERLKEHAPMQKIVESRKREYEMYRQLPAYSRLIFTGAEFNKHHTCVNSTKIYQEDTEIRGIPCSNGTVTGEALVVEDISRLDNVKDKILVTKMTDPGWVFLLAMAKGVVSEKGSLLSHTAIISREIKVPSIVGVDNVLNLIRTGDTIRMDGGTGVVEILKRAGE